MPIVPDARPRLILKPRRARPFYGRHPWVFAGAVDHVEGEPQDGEEIDVHAHGGAFVARGLFNSVSKIRARLYTWDVEQELDRAFWKKIIDHAVRLRRDHLGWFGPQSACRVLFSEADGCSGLVVDKYGDYVTVQFTGLGLAKRREEIADILMESLNPNAVILRTERGMGELEGMELSDGVLRGELPNESVVVEEGGLRFRIDLKEGQKTGFYLDQRDNRQRVAQFARGRRVLDAFCYTGGFGIHAATAGASQVVGVDVSERALHLAQENAQANSVGNISFERSDVFDHLDHLVERDERFGMVILDPPKFARRRRAVADAMRGYRRLQSLSMRLLESDGILVMCCCSGLITGDMIQELLQQVAVSEKRTIQILERRGPSADHPVSVACPESNYLKCLVCRVI